MNQSQVRQIFAAVDSLELASFAVFLSDDVRLQFGNSPTVQGKEAVLADLKAFYALLSAMHHELKQLWVNDQTATVEAVVTYILRNGKEITIPSVTVLGFNAESLVNSDHIYMDITPVVQVSTPSVEEVKNNALRFYPPIQSGDTANANEFLHSNWQDVPLNKGQTPGPAGFSEMIGKLRGFIPDLVWEIEDVIVGGDKVVVRSLISGIPKAKLAGLHFSGNRVSFEAIDIHQVVDGKIATTWHVEDKMAILQQFGVPHLSFRE